MAKRPELSKGELTVARAVWRLREGSVGSIHEEVSHAVAMDYSTVQTYLRRLEAKGYLRTKREGRNKIYSAKVQATQVIRETVRDLVGRLFDGEVVAMVNHLVRDHGMSKEDLQELRSVLAELEDADDVS
ncbi:MAG: BlaI/MecI/CopY family transcriptional regulator [Planctomycetes bacterium]|nr:BlaI/MecI/CopY family transcriptional regulator [Planctomycetota bacterium]